MTDEYRDAYVLYDGEPYSSISGDETVPFRELTGFEWETVTVFEVGVTEQMLEGAIGRDFIASDRNHSRPFLVFCGDGDIVRVVEYRAGLGVWPEDDGFQTYSAEVLWGPNAPNGAHMLTEPDDRTVAPACGGAR